MNMISFVILNYNSSCLTLQCVESVVRHVPEARRDAKIEGDPLEVMQLNGCFMLFPAAKFRPHKWYLLKVATCGDVLSLSMRHRVA